MKNITTSQAYADGTPWYILVMNYAIIAVFLLFLVLVIPTNAVGTNLIQNPSLEQASPSDATLALGWSKDKWGTNTPVFTHLTTGQDGVRSGKVQITAYTSGDAKWSFAHVPVVPGTTYQFSEYYQSDVTTELVIEYKNTNNVFSYVSLGNVPAAAGWTAVSKSFTVPVWMQSLTVYHVIKSVGNLTIDTVSLSTGSVIPPPPPPPVPVTGNLISNPSVETVSDTVASMPLDWDIDFWGTNKPTFTYPIAGQDGAKWLRVQMTAYTSGDAKWYFKHVPVTPGKTYTFSDYYQSDVSTTVTLEYKTSAGALSYADIGILPAATAWTQFTKTFVPPASAAAVTVLHHIDTIGFLNTDNFSLSLPSTGTGGTGTGSTWTGSTGTGTADTAPPSIFITSPSGSGGVLSGTVSLSATGSDNVGIAGVQFLLDGAVIGSEIAAPPYSLNWNSTTVSDGSHQIAARARDAAGNTTTSAPITVNIVNTVAADTIPPVISLTSPTDNSTLSGALKLTATATDNIGVTGVTFFVDNIAVGSGTTGTGSTTSYTSLLDSTTLTNGVHTVFAKAVDVANNSGSTASISVTINNPIPDTEAPKVSITSPKGWSILSGTSTLNISATDNVGVTTVHYSISNGTDVIVGQFTAAPYTVTIPANALKNGSHTITVYAQDAAGNIWNATPVIYNTFYLPPAPLNPNLILNPSLEAGTGGIPDYWAKGGWGTNTSNFTYPVAGVNGVNAAEVSMTSWTNGDAKWYFADVPVDSGATYTFSDQYKSTTTSTLTARYTHADGTISYVDIVSNLPASASWITSTQTIIIPVNVVKVTIFHLISSVGTLDIDNAELRLSSADTSSGPLDPNAFPTGLVSLTFDDGWGSQYDSALPILNAAGIKGSFYIITNEMKNAVNANRISNPSFEVSDSATAPSGWTGVTTGVNNAVFTYPVTGVSGGKAAKVEIASYTSGDARWQSDSTTVANGEAYNFTDQYMASAPTKVTVVYTLTNNTTQTFDLGTVLATSNWSLASFTFTPPVNTKTLTVYHRLLSIGTLTTDDYHLDIAQDYMNLSQIKDIYNAGHEVSAHTRTHPFLTQLTASQATSEIEGARQDMIAVGFTPADTFVYPYGDYNSGVIQITQNAGYIGARSVDQGYNTQATNKYALMIQEVNSATTAAQWESWTQTALKNHTWLILMFHQIDHQVDQYGATPEELQKYVNYISANGIPTVTMQQGLGLMGP